MNHFLRLEKTGLMEYVLGCKMMTNKSKKLHGCCNQGCEREALETLFESSIGWATSVIHSAMWKPYNQ
jgi:hypothetical protein